ncbi:Protein tesmin/TSO1-like CXC 5 [Frankliniella fusca]|uniref:Protein tesmin/TSO1-like CXC 5 n=1 Tax=Frankliniella fusca TaxID=407009 RepID=A0AAE1GUZ4_9NEOP|nr:Protein tesmin/TSO1-like CXC 5 [Frankliniella fusca]
MTVKCGCKKSNCDTKRCKCFKASSFCSSDCLCESQKCQNQKVKEEKDIVTWEEMETWYTTELAQLRKLKEISEKVPENLKKKFLTIKSLGISTEIDGAVQMMEQVNFQQKGEIILNNILTEAEWEEFNNGLQQCQFCGRKFVKYRWEKHEPICQRISRSHACAE